MPAGLEGFVTFRGYQPVGGAPGTFARPQPGPNRRPLRLTISDVIVEGWPILLLEVRSETLHERAGMGVGGDDRVALGPDSRICHRASLSGLYHYCPPLDGRRVRPSSARFAPLVESRWWILPRPTYNVKGQRTVGYGP